MKKILIIDDEEDVVKVLRHRLQDNHFDVIAAQDAYQGNHLAHQEHPDVIILDLMLPAGGGLKTLQNLRLSTQTSSIPVVVLTGMKDEAYKEQILTEGVEGYFEKPYDFAALLSAIHRIFQKRESL